MDELDYNGEFDDILQLPDIDLIGVVAGIQCADLLHRLHAEYPAEAVMERGRFAIRAVAACCAPAASWHFVAILTGCTMVEDRLFMQMLNATGPWSDELGYEALRVFLHAVIIEGTHPRALADAAKIDPDEYNTLNHLLELEMHWRDTQMARVAVAALGGYSRSELRKLGGFSWWRAHLWYRWGRGVRRTAGQQ